MRIICFSLFFLLSAEAWSLDTLRIQAGTTKQDVLHHALFTKSEQNASVQDILNRLREKPSQFSVLDKANQGYSDKIIWVVIPIQIELTDSEYRIEIQNPHLDYIQGFLVRGDSIADFGKPTGDELLFSQRPAAHRNFIWALPQSKQSETLALLFRIEKLNSSLFLPMVVWETNSFRIQETKLLITYGICFGIMLIVMVYSLGLGFLLKQRIQFLYVGLLATSILYFLISEGFAFQFIYPNVQGINGFMRLIILAVSTIAFILFAKSFLNIRQHHSIISIFLNCLVGLMAMMVLLTPVIADFYLKYSSFFIPFILGTTFLGNLLPLVVAVSTFRKQKETAIFFLIAYSAILITSTFVRLEDIGWIERLAFNPVYIGTFVENMVFFTALGYRMKKVYDQRNEFSHKISKHQKEMMQSYVHGTEQERQRIARDLHDDIGSRMSHLKRQMESQHQHELMGQVDSLCTDIRNLSHQLAPQSIRFNSLTQMIEQQIYLLHQAGIAVNFQQYDFPEDLNATTKAELLRILQEAMNNILKHAHAKNVDIQLFKHDHQLVITIEDDGHGFDEQNHQAGIGLSNMRARAESLDGTLEVSSKAGQGTSILLTLPHTADN
jgi:signal transduction histidine kinase